MTTEALTLCGRTFEPTHGVSQFLAPEPTGGQRVQKAVLFSDIIGSTPYFERFGDEAGVAMLERLHSLALPVLTQFGGQLIKKIGDALMVGFDTPGQAIRAAINVQRTLAEVKDPKTGEPCLERIGIGFGSLIEREGDLFGDVVNTTARIEGMGEGGQILCSAAAFQEVDFELDCPVRLFDAVPVRGHVQSLDIFEICWDGLETRRDVNRAAIGGRFELRGLLGEGGMGQVYRALDRALDEEVALKFVRADLASSPEALEQFKAEVRLSRSLTHRNICRIYEFLEMEGRVFLSMELCRGQTLAQVIAKEAPMPIGRVVEICRGICRGLQAAHRCGIVHRDLKPSNVMIEAETDRVVVMDFGIAMLAQSDTGKTVQGTPEYMAPEQAMGKPQTQRTDIYALGAVMYEMLTGKPPILRDDPIATAAAQVTTRPWPLCSKRPDASRELGAIVDRCLQKKPEARFKDAEAVRRDLEALSASKSHTHAGWWLAAGILLVVLAGIAFFLHGHAPLKLGPMTPLVRSEAFEHHAELSPDGSVLAFIRGRSLMLTRPDLGEFAVQNLVALDTGVLAGLSWMPDGNSLFVTTSEGALVQVKSYRGEQTLKIPNAGAPDVSPDGHWLVFLRLDVMNRPSVMFCDLTKSEPEVKPLLLASADRAYLSPQFSPDGNHILVSVWHNPDAQVHGQLLDNREVLESDLAVLDLNEGDLKMLTKDRKGYLDPLFAPDGESILFVREAESDRGLWQRTPLGQQKLLYQHPSLSFHAPKIAANRLVTSLEESWNDIALWTLESPQPMALSGSADNDVRYPRFGRENNSIYYLKGKADRTQLEIAFLHASQKLYLPAPHDMGPFAVCDGEQLLFLRHESQEMTLNMFDTRSIRTRLHTIDLTDAENQVAKHVTTLFRARHLSFPACARGQNAPYAFLARFGDEKDRVWLARDGQFEVLSSVEEIVSYPTFSPDGQKLAWRSDRFGQTTESVMRVYDLKTRHTETWPLPKSLIPVQGRIHFSPQGNAFDFLETNDQLSILWRWFFMEGQEPVRVIQLQRTSDFEFHQDGSSIVYPRSRQLGDIYQADFTN